LRGGLCLLPVKRGLKLGTFGGGSPQAAKFVFVGRKRSETFALAQESCHFTTLRAPGVKLHRKAGRSERFSPPRHTNAG
jgi:hypothetical protein